MFDAPLLGDVAKVDGQDLVAADLELRDRGVGGELLAVLAQAEDRNALWTPSAASSSGPAAKRSTCWRCRLGTVRGSRCRAGLPIASRLRVAEHLLGALVEHRDALVSSIEMIASAEIERIPEDVACASRSSSSACLRVVMSSTVPTMRSGLALFVAGEDLAAIEDPDPLARLGLDADTRTRTRGFDRAK